MDLKEENIVRTCRKKKEIVNVKEPLYTKDEYKQQIIASIRLYKFVNTSWKLRARPAPFLFRNLLYVDCATTRLKPFTLGLDEPPLAFKKYIHKKKMVSIEDKKKRISKIVRFLSSRNLEVENQSTLYRSLSEKNVQNSETSNEMGMKCSKSVDLSVKQKLQADSREKNENLNPAHNSKSKRKRDHSGNRLDSSNAKRIKSDHESRYPLQNIQNVMSYGKQKVPKEDEYFENAENLVQLKRTYHYPRTEQKVMELSSLSSNVKLEVPLFATPVHLHQHTQEHPNRKNDALQHEIQPECDQKHSVRIEKSMVSCKRRSVLRANDKRFVHPFDLKRRRGKRYYGLSVYSYLGNHPKENSVYVNANKFVKDYFTRKFLNRKDISERLQQIFPIKCPRKLLYRMIGVNAEDPKNMPRKKDAEHLMKRDERYFLDTETHEWTAFWQTKSSNQCIICQRLFPTFYSLLFHYNVSYPRLKFVLKMPKIIEDRRYVPEIDISLNTLFHEELENFSLSESGKVGYREPMFLSTAYHRFLLKTQVYMDLTIFTGKLLSPDMIGRFIKPKLAICTRTGRVGGRNHHEEHPNYIPDESYHFLTRYTNSIILDFTDIDDESKEYMCYWNDLGFLMGRRFRSKLGLYFRLRVFISKYGSVMRKNNVETPFLCHMKYLVENRLLDTARVTDIIMRFFDATYHPLDDCTSQICQVLAEYTRKMRSRYIKSLAHPGRKIVRRKRKVILRFNKHYHIDPYEISVERRKQLFAFILKETKFGKSLRDKKWQHLHVLLPIEDIAATFPREFTRICELPMLNWRIIPETSLEL